MSSSRPSLDSGELNGSSAASSNRMLGLRSQTLQRLHRRDCPQLQDGHYSPSLQYRKKKRTPTLLYSSCPRILRSGEGWNGQYKRIRGALLRHIFSSFFTHSFSGYKLTSEPRDFFDRFLVSPWVQLSPLGYVLLFFLSSLISFSSFTSVAIICHQAPIDVGVFGDVKVNLLCMKH